MKNLSELIKPITFTNIRHTTESFEAVMNDFHNPDSYEIIYVVSGTLNLEYNKINDHKIMCAQLIEGQFAIISPKTMHKHSTPNNVHILVFEITNEKNAPNISQLLRNSRFINSLPEFEEHISNINDVAVFNDLTDVKKVLLKLTQFLYRSYNENLSPTFDAQFEIYIKQLLLEIYRSSPELGITKAYNKHLYACLRLIKNNRTITVNVIAKKLGVTVPYLSTLFKNEFNITLKKYISNKKIEHAKKLLEETDTTLTTIAKSLGYKSLRSFDIVFTKEVGVTPMKYRTNIKNKEFFLWLKKSNDTFELGEQIEKKLTEK